MGVVRDGQASQPFVVDILCRDFSHIICCHCQCLSIGFPFVYCRWLYLLINSPPLLLVSLDIAQIAIHFSNCLSSITVSIYGFSRRFYRWQYTTTVIIEYGPANPKHRIWANLGLSVSRRYLQRTSSRNYNIPRRICHRIHH